MICHDSRAVVYVPTAVGCCPSAARHRHQLVLAAAGLVICDRAREICRSSLFPVEQLLEEVQCRGPDFRVRRLGNGDRDVLTIDTDLESGTGGRLVRGSERNHGWLTTGGEVQAGRPHRMLKRRP